MLFVCACGGDSSVKIVGGVEIRNTENTNLLLSSAGLSTPEINRENKTFCSSVILSDRFLLTAAHCVEQYRNYHTGDIIAVFGNVSDEGRAQRAIAPIKVQGIAIHQSYQKILDRNKLEKVAANDLALLYLETPVPSPFRAVEIVNQHQNVSEYTNIVLSGYGVTGGLISDDSGVLRAVDVTKKFESSNTKTIELIGPKLQGNRIEENEGGGYVYKESTGGSCKGDSGGPAYIWGNGKFQLLGITAFGDSQRLASTPNGPTYCVGASFVTDLRYYSSYLSNAMKAIENGYGKYLLPFYTDF